jgi:MYXO-CTERM domain-containing protein
MARSTRWLGLAIVAALVVGLGATASADQPRVHPKTFTTQLGATTVPDGMISPWIYFNRCTGGGCVVHGTTSDDARDMNSSIPCPSPQCTVGSCECTGGPSGTWTVHEFANQFGQTGSNGTCYGDGATLCTQDSQCSGTCTGGGGTTCTGGTKTGMACTTDTDCADICDSADYEWNQVMQCLKDIYSPYDVNITDQLPPNGVSYTEDLLAGTGDDIGYPPSSGVGGLAPVPCTAQGNVLTFSFANINWGKGQDRIWNLCYVAAQESAHPMGIEHEYSYLDAYPSNDNSTCMDPMTYRTDCGGEHFFRNAPSNCGEFMERACSCGGAQNDHQKLLNAYGAGTSTIPAPTSSIVLPAAGTTVDGAFSVTASSGSRRGVTSVELWLNGYKWASQPGAAFMSNGQPDPSQYNIAAPATVPNSVIDVVIKAYDDLGAETDSPTVTITKVGPCSADTDCSSAAPGQECSTMHATDYPGGPGRCFWPAPTGVLGDPCSYDQFCTSGECSPTTTNQVCSQDCTVGIAGTCPDNYDCVMRSGIDGFCYPSAKTTDSGCCRVDGNSNAVWLHGGIAALVLGLVTRRRKRRA